MSYERKMLEELKMPTRKEVEQALLKSLFNHNGVIKEFGAGEEIVEEIANDFGLNEEQRTAYLKTIRNYPMTYSNIKIKLIKCQY